MSQISLKKLLFVAMILILVTPIVSGLTETGEFRTSSYSQFLADDLSAGTAFSLDTSQRPLSVYTTEISAINGLDWISIEFEGIKPYTDDGNISATAPFTSEYGTGTIGYVNLYNYAGVWQAGYLYVYFDSPLVVTTTGAKNILLNYTISEMHGFRFLTNGATRVYQSSPANIKYGSQQLACIADYTIGVYPSTAVAQGQRLYNNINRQFKNDYSVTLNENNIVTGTITKNIAGAIYPSKTVVLDAYNNIVASEPALSSSTYNFISNTAPIRLTTLDGYGTWHNTSLLLSPEIIYDYSLSPSTTYPNESVLIAISSNEAGTQLTQLKYISFDIQSDKYNGGNKFFATDQTGNYLNYLKNSSNYWGIYTSNGYVFNLGTTTPNNFDITFPASGNWSIYSTFEDLVGNQYYDIKNYTVLGNVGQLKLAIYPVDGYDGSFVVGSEIDLLDTQTGIWTNKTVTEISQCAFLVSTGFYKFVVYAPDDSYSDVNQGVLEGIFIVNEDVATTVTLFPKDKDGTAIPGDIVNSTVYIGIKEPDQLRPIYGATVSISPSGKVATTNFVGIASFTLINGTPYKATATGSGYETTSVSFTPNAAVYSFDITMGSGGQVPTAVTTSTPTPTITPTFPVPTTTAGGGYTGFWGPLFDGLGAMGAKNTELGPLMAGFFVFCGVVVGGLGPAAIIPNSPFSAGGSTIGGLLGFTLSCVFQFISPLWIIVVILLVVFWAVFMRG